MTQLYGHTTVPSRKSFPPLQFFFLKQLGKVYLAQSEENADVLVFHSMVFEFDFVTTCVHPVPSVADLALGVRC
jgi:hypothetical protein